MFYFAPKATAQCRWPDYLNMLTIFLLLVLTYIAIAISDSGNKICSFEFERGAVKRCGARRPSDSNGSLFRLTKKTSDLLQTYVRVNASYNQMSK